MYFDIDAHRGCFNTSPNEAYFWHGQTNGCGGQNNAMDIATENDGKTLEKCMLEHRNELENAGVRYKDNDDGTVSIDYGNTMDESKRFWEDCSKAFAEQASGNVHVIEGTDPRPNGQSESDYPSVYNRIEHPALEQNQNVNGITHINPSDGKITDYEPIDHKNTCQDASESVGANSQIVASENGVRPPDTSARELSSQQSSPDSQPFKPEDYIPQNNVSNAAGKGIGTGIE